MFMDSYEFYVILRDFNGFKGILGDFEMFERFKGF